MSQQTELYLRLKKLISETSYDPGLPVPTRDFERLFGVSSVPIREALIRLSHDGLLNHIHGKGFFLKHLELEECMNALEALAYFVCDAANYISGHQLARESLTRSISAKDVVDFKYNDSYESYCYFHNIRNLICEHYRMPQARYMQNAFDLTDPIIYWESVCSNELDNRFFLLKYLVTSLSSDDKRTDPEVIEEYLSVRRERLQDTLSFIYKRKAGHPQRHRVD